MSHVSRAGGLQKKFFLSLLTVGILPGIAALTVTYLYSTESLKHSIGSSFQEIARSTAIRIGAAVDTEIDRAARLAEVPILVRNPVHTANQRYAGKSEVDIVHLLERERSAWGKTHRAGGPSGSVRTAAYLTTWASHAGHHVSVVITDARGAVVAATDTQVPYLHGDQEWWQEVTRAEPGAAYVSPLRHDSSADDYVFDVGVPILDQDRATTIGALRVVLRREVLMGTILPIQIGETGHGMLLDTEGTPLICPVLPPTAHLIHEALVEQVTENRPLWLVADDDAHGGRNSIVGAAPVRLTNPLTPASLGGHRWFAFIRQDPHETYAPIYSLLTTVGMIGFGLVVLLSSLGFFVGRKIVSPILSLQQEAESLRRDLVMLPAPGSIDGGIPTATGVQIRTDDEIEDLARAFYSMRAALEDSFRTVKSQQEELIRREKLASVGRLLAALAHDLRNPLSVIRSSAQLVGEGGQPDAVKQEMAQYIMEEVDCLTNRIHDFLRYARQKPPERKATQPDTIMEAALKEWKAQGGHEHVRVETSFQEDLPCVSVDPSQVKEALVNLLINAKEAMPAGGQVMLTTRDGRDGSVEAEVADTGCGIPSDHLARIFEPFYTTKEYGTGLGLTNVKRLVEDNGGTVEVFSEPGKGSRFMIRFPTAGTSDSNGGKKVEDRPCSLTA